MSASRIALPLLAVLALAVAAFLFLRDGAPPERAPALAGERSAPAVSPVAADLRGADGVTLAETAAGAERAAVAAEVRPEVAGAEGQPAPLRTQAVYTGLVLDIGGLPIVGADVELRPALGPTSFLAGPLVRAKTRTDSEGAYRLPADSQGGTLVVGADGYSPFQRPAPPGAANQEVPVEPVVLARGGEISGRVVDAAGRGVAGVAIDREPSENDLFLPRLPAFLGGSEDDVLGRSDDQGFFQIRRMPLGPFRLRFDSPAHPLRLVEGAVDEAQPRLTGLTVELAEGASISGIVLNFTQPAEPWQVSAAVSGGRGGFGGGPFGGVERSGEVRPDGTFEVLGLAPDTTYRLRLERAATGDGLAGMMAMATGRMSGAAVTARSGARDVELEWVAPAVLVLRAVDGTTNQPVERFRADYLADRRNTFANFGSSAEPAHWPGGVARLEGLSVRPDRPGRLTVEADGYRRLELDEVRLTPGAVLDLGDLVLEPAPSLEVFVRDARTGVPVAGAQVRLSQAGGGLASMLGGGMQRGGRASMANVRVATGPGGRLEVNDGNTATARTDERGFALLSSPGGESGVLEVRSDAHAPYVEKEVALPSEGRVRKDVTVGQGGSVEVRVLEGNGEPKAGASVAHRAPGAEQDPMSFLAAPLATDGQGRLRLDRLAPGTHGFRVEESNPSGAGGFVFRMGAMDNQRPWVEVSVVEGQTATVELSAEPKGQLDGRVREAGRSLADAQVELVRRGDDGEDWAMPAAFGGGQSVRTDGQGRFSFKDVSPGSYRLRVSHRRRAMAEEFDVEVAVGYQRRDVDLSNTVVEGRVTFADGTPAANLRVRAERAASSARRGPRARAFVATLDGDSGEVVTVGDGLGGDGGRTDADGRYRLSGLPLGVDVVVTASGDGVAETRSSAIRLAPDEVRTGVDLTAVRSGDISVRIVDAAGNPTGMALVRATLEGAEASGDDPFTFAGSDGNATLRGLVPGRWRVSAARRGGSGSEANADGEVTVVAGQTAEVTLQLGD